VWSRRKCEWPRWTNVRPRRNCVCVWPRRNTRASRRHL